MKLAKGHTIITVPIISLFAGTFLLTMVLSASWVITAIFAGLTLFVLQFFRDPDREPDDQVETAILSPADGVLFETTLLNDTIVVFRIRMRFWDVHVNRMPVAGTLIKKEKYRGFFLPVIPGINKFSKHMNARQELIYQHARGFTFKVVQVSGLLAIRCVAYHSIEQFISRGERIGMIRFGSETDLHLPKDKVKNIIAVGAKVKAGQTVLCYLNE